MVGLSFLSLIRYGAHMEDLVVNGLDVKPINYIAVKVHTVTIVFAIVIVIDTVMVIAIALAIL